MKRKFVSINSMIAIATLSFVVLVQSFVLADQDTSPDYFTIQSISSTGSFGWDEFTGGAAGPHSPDVIVTGAGTAPATSPPDPLPGGWFPPLVTSTQNLYAGPNFVTWTIGLSSLDATESFTTVVLQLASQGPLSPILLDGNTPTSFVDRGVAPGVIHNTDGATPMAADTNYYWAEWQLPAASSYSLTANNPAHHISLAAARVDYFNQAGGYFDAVEPGLVPEPSSLVLGGLALCCAWRYEARRRNRKEDRLS
jgi:hypothetical protein